MPGFDIRLRSFQKSSARKDIRLLVNISPITAAFKSVSDTLYYNTEGIRLGYLSLNKVLLRAVNGFLRRTPD